MSAENLANDVSVQAITDVQRFEQLKADWDRVCCGLPFRTFEWNYHWWRHFGADRSLLILAVYDAGVCIGIAPFFVERSLSVGRVVQFIGSGEVASDQQTILSAPSRSSDVGTAIANWLCGRHGCGSSEHSGPQSAVRPEICCSWMALMPVVQLFRPSSTNSNNFVSSCRIARLSTPGGFRCLRTRTTIWRCCPSRVAAKFARL